VPVVSAARQDAFRSVRALTDEEVREQFDELVAEAARGDLRAIGAIAIALGPTLLKEARRGLGKGREHEAGDVLQAFFLAMTEGTMAFAGEQGTGLAWMKRMVRQGARPECARPARVLEVLV
jgi:DNA-directed RNA polymerase specialized sigma24 family protein